MLIPEIVTLEISQPFPSAGMDEDGPTPSSFTFEVQSSLFFSEISIENGVVGLRTRSSQVTIKSIPRRLCRLYLCVYDSDGSDLHPVELMTSTVRSPFPMPSPIQTAARTSTFRVLGIPMLHRCLRLMTTHCNLTRQ